MSRILDTPTCFFKLLEKSDYSPSLFEVLGQLTSAPLPSQKDFDAYMDEVAQQYNKHLNIIGVEKSSGKIIGFGSVIVMNSVLWGRVGKIENIVTCKSVRGQGLGKVIIETLKELGWREKCNKITLFCEEKNIKFYEKLGFSLEGQIYACYKQ